ncbi:MAG: phage minor head protein [Polyangiales bacterium]
MSFGAVPQTVQIPTTQLQGLSQFTALLDRAEPRVRRRFLELVNAANALDDLEQVADLLEQGNIQGALAVTEEIAPGLATALDTAYTAAGLSAAEVLRSQVPTLLEFNQLNVRAVQAQQAGRLRLITGLSSQQREATEILLNEALMEGLAPVAQARALKQSIGLTARQAQAVRNYRRLLQSGSSEALQRTLRDRRFDPSVRAAIRGDRALTSDQIDRMVDRYAERQLAFRARTIARTETVRALNEGDEELWNQAVEQGVVAAEDVSQVWHTARDERVRASHRAMNNQRRGLGEPFQSGLGNALRFPADPQAPARDTINCRCVVAREIKREARPARVAA